MQTLVSSFVFLSAPCPARFVAVLYHSCSFTVLSLVSPWSSWSPWRQRQQLLMAYPPLSVLPPSTSDTEREAAHPEFTRCAQLCWWCIRDVQASAEIDSKVVRRRVRQCCWNSGHPWWSPRHWHACAQCCGRALDAPGGRVKVINYKGERVKIGPPGFSDEDASDCSDKQ